MEVLRQRRLTRPSYTMASVFVLAGLCSLDLSFFPGLVEISVFLSLPDFLRPEST